MKEHWSEVANSISTHKARSIFAMITASWGVFMLVILMGISTGIQNGVTLQFKDDAINQMQIQSGLTSVPYNGLAAGLKITLQNDDMDAIRTHVDNVDTITGMFSMGAVAITANGASTVSTVRGVTPEHFNVSKLNIRAGRFINQLDELRSRNVAVISDVTAELFRDESNIPILRKNIEIAGEVYTVIGEYSHSDSPRGNQEVYIPLSTAQRYFQTNELHDITYTLKETNYLQSKESESKTLTLLANHHSFSVQDSSAVRIHNNLDQYNLIVDLFFWVKLFVATVGIGTVLTGILALSNIMVISVKERTREFGIRKSLGATPISITQLVVTESLLITTIAGLMGFVTALGILSALRSAITENHLMYNPEIKLGAGILVVVLIVIAGTLAGYLPAKKATSIVPIEAIR